MAFPGDKVSFAFQPIVDVEAREVFSYEALIRGEFNESPAVLFAGVPAAELADFDQRSRRVALSLAAQLGVGYSGLNLLAQFQPDIVKLDMTLVQNIDGDGPRQAIVRAVSQVCLDLGIDIIAEGVERPEEYAWLREVGFHLFQGYLFAQPGFECLPDVNYPD